VNRRSAIAVAGGLTGALVSGVAGYSVRVASSDAATAPATTKPIIKHKTKTITIHKKAKSQPVAHVAPAPAVQTVVVHRAPHVVHLPPRPAPPPPAVHHTGGSTHGGTGGGEDQGDRGEHDGGGDD